MRLTRSCDDAHDGEDPRAALVAIPGIFHSDGGADVYERATVTVATTDFVMSGGSGDVELAGISASGPTEPLRDAVARELTSRRTLAPASYARVALRRGVKRAPQASSFVFFLPRRRSR